MKLMISILLLSASVAQASVDYVSITKLLKNGNELIEMDRAGVTCLLEKLVNDPTCDRLGSVVSKLDNMLNESDLSDIYGCGDKAFALTGVKSIKAMSLDLINMKLTDATSEDPIRTEVQKFDKTLNQFIDETNGYLTAGNFHEIYHTQCISN